MISACAPYPRGYTRYELKGAGWQAANLDLQHSQLGGTWLLYVTQDPARDRGLSKAFLQKKTLPYDLIRQGWGTVGAGVG